MLDLPTSSKTSRTNPNRRPVDDDTWKSMNNVAFQYSKQEKTLLNPVTRFGSNPHIRNYAVGICKYCIL